MKCPLDQTELLITERQGVEIDYCPTCRGVWLDRGELDKLIDRADAYDRRDRSRDDDRDERPYQPQSIRGGEPGHSRGGSGPDIAGMVGEVLKKKLGEGQRGDGHRGDHRGYKKKKGGLFGDLFDF